MATVNSAHRTIEFYQSSVVTSGQIIRLQYGGHHPVMAFDAGGGKRYETSTNTWWIVEVGQVVPLRYKPDNPTHSVKLDRFIDLWTPTIFLALLTVFCVTTGLSGKKFREGRF
jgi:hypothetical protein